MNQFDPATTSDILLELCAASVDDVVTAAEVGVDRVELNCGFPVGGLTPTQGLYESAVAEFAGPVIAMIRPREGDFFYSRAERLQMYRDADLLLSAGVDGLATGFLSESYAIDESECTRFRRATGSTSLVFHRAFDLCEDLASAAQTLVDCGFDRILTSGGAATATAGTPTLRRLIDRFGHKIEILPAGGIRANNVTSLIRETGATQVHTAARGVVERRPPSRPGNMAAQSTEWLQHGHTCRNTLMELRRALNESGGDR